MKLSDIVAAPLQGLVCLPGPVLLNLWHTTLVSDRRAKLSSWHANHFLPVLQSVHYL